MNQVNNGKITKPVQEPMNRADQTESVSSETNFHAYQKAILAGIPHTIDDKIGLSFQKLEHFCKLTWYHPNICPKKKIKIPIYNFINVSAD